MPVGQMLQDGVYTIQYRPPELLAKTADLSALSMERCDARAAGMTLLEVGSCQKFFTGAKVDVVKQIQDFKLETTSTMSGPLLRRLKESLIKLHFAIRRSVSGLVQADPKCRVPCTKFAIDV